MAAIYGKKKRKPSVNQNINKNCILGKQFSYHFIQNIPFMLLKIKDFSK